jgi:hypothetical protein
MERKFILVGYRPAYGKKANELMKAFDLGVEGVFIPFSEIVTIGISDDVTEEQLEKQPDAIMHAYEKTYGCIDLSIEEIDLEAEELINVVVAQSPELDSAL